LRAACVSCPWPAFTGGILPVAHVRLCGPPSLYGGIIGGPRTDTGIRTTQLAVLSLDPCPGPDRFRDRRRDYFVTDALEFIGI
jgi:hypothetical protein